MGASELQQLASERKIATQGADAAALRDALRGWASEQLGSRGGQGTAIFPTGSLEEREAPFSNAEGGQLFAAGALGLVNFGGAAYLGQLPSPLDHGTPSLTPWDPPAEPCMV